MTKTFFKKVHWLVYFIERDAEHMTTLIQIYMLKHKLNYSSEQS